MQKYAIVVYDKRNGGKGRFVWDEMDENGRVIGGNNEFEE